MDWISVEERLPPSNIPVLVCTPGYAIPVRVSEYSCGYREDDEEWYEEWLWVPNGAEVTHWMPLPKPPNEEKQGDPFGNLNPAEIPTALHTYSYRGDDKNEEWRDDKTLNKDYFSNP